ncbi:MAG TPA: hypothetical protein VLE89_09025 [Chlamydiales bacterium]|nr:hypothetical protein [Chlamydiales bacterium]
MTLSPAASSFLQKRTLNENAHYDGMVWAFIQNVASRVRCAALTYLANNQNVTPQGATIKIVIPPKKMGQILGASINEIKPPLKPQQMTKLLAEMRVFCDQIKANELSISLEECAKILKEDMAGFLLLWKKEFQAKSHRNYIAKMPGLEIIDIFESDFPSHVRAEKPVTDLSCHKYALYRSGIRIPFALEGTENLANDVFPRLGLHPVREPKAGDFVVFLKNKEPQHTGIVREDGRILSKYGDETPFAILHSLEDTPDSYGNQIIYYRKSPSTLGNALLLLAITIALLWIFARKSS